MEAKNINGLTTSEVVEKTKLGLNNKTPKKGGKTIPNILFKNFVSFFNLFLIALAILLIIAKQYTSCGFIVIYGCNIGINIYQDIKAYKLLKKLKLLADPKVTVIRNGKEETIHFEDVVLNDVVIFKTSNQIVTDSIIIDGEIGINESLLTGESQIVYKKAGDTIYSGTFVVSGKCRAEVIHVGKDNYINQLEGNAFKQKAKKSELKATLDVMYKILSIVVICFGVVLTITKWNRLTTDFYGTIGEFAGALIAMIPAGLYLLSSIALSVGVINLSKKHALVQDFYSIEMLARCSTLCLDKTGTITDGTLDITELLNLSPLSNDEVGDILLSLTTATEDENATAKAINHFYKNRRILKPDAILPFDSANKYSAFEYKGITYVLGALECLNIKNKSNYQKKIKDYLTNGYRVLTLGKTKSKINKGKIDGEIEIIAFIIMKDHIRENALETFAWFHQNGVKIRVISGDNAQTVSEIARQAGIENYDKWISLDGLSLEEVKQIAPKYYVFGRVTPEQKEVIVDALKEAGEIVAMTGDGVNDILALRKADCSIAMAEGSDAARNVSQLVLMNSDFGSLPSVVGEGRRVVNNVQRTSSLFLTKTFFAIMCTLIFMILEWCGIFKGYPFKSNYLYLWELTTIGIGSFLLALEPNNEVIDGKFFKNIVKNSFPGSLTLVAMVIYVYLLYYFKIGIFTEDVAKSVCALLFATLPFTTFWIICSPFSKYRKWVFVGVLVLNILCIGVQACLSLFNITDEPFLIKFKEITAFNYVEIIIGLATLGAIYIGGYRIYEKVRNNKNDKNK